MSTTYVLAKTNLGKTEFDHFARVSVSSSAIDNARLSLINLANSLTVATVGDTSIRMGDAKRQTRKSLHVRTNSLTCEHFSEKLAWLIEVCQIRDRQSSGPPEAA